MRTYASVFRTPEFGALFATSGIQVGAQTLAGLARSTLVYTATGSPLLAALSLFGPSLAQVIGATVLLSATDRLPSRAAMTVLSLIFAAGTAAQALPGLPIWGGFVLVMSLGLVSSVGSGVRFGLLTEILPPAGYLLGRPVLNMTVGAMQICGFAAGGALIVFVSPRGALLVAAGGDLLAAAVAWLCLRRRAARAAGRPSVAETWRTNAILWSSTRRRHLYLALWVPNGLIVGCESLFVPYSPDHAGLLFGSAAAGMLIGDTLTGRFVAAWMRERLGPPLRLLLAVPYLVFAVHPLLPVAVGAVALASVGYSASLLLQERLMALTPERMSGHAQGLQSAGTLTMQGVGAALAGLIAQGSSPAAAMTVLAVLSIGVTLALTPGLRPDRPRPSAVADEFAPVRAPNDSGPGEDRPTGPELTGPGAGGQAPGARAEM